MWNGEGSESEVHREVEASELDFGVYLFLRLSGGGGSISVTSGLFLLCSEKMERFGR